MSEQPSQSSSPRADAARLAVADLTFLENGPYNFTLDRGECLGLGGASGVGKSQLLRAVADLIPYNGTILLDGVSVNEFEAPLWRRAVSLVPADPVWWYDLVGDHFSGIKKDAFFLDILGRLGFEAEVFNWQVSRLSTGEKQRLGLLRGLGNNPTVLLLDEPTSGLDGYHAGKLEAIVGELMTDKGVSVIWVGHDPGQLHRIAGEVRQVTVSGLTRYQQ